MDDAAPHSPVVGLSILDYAVVLVALAVMLVIGVLAGRRERSTQEFFLADRRIPAWAACLSFVATEISALTIVGVPADAYRANWNYAQLFIGSALARLAVAYLFIPVFFSAQCTTIYQYLAQRFGTATQYCATGFFFVTRLLASGVRLYLAAGAVAVILALDRSMDPVLGLLIVIIAFTILPIIFIGIGGMKAVIWTNVYQAIMFLAGGVAVLLYLHASLPDGIASVLASAFPIGPEASARAATAIPEAKAVFVAAAESGSRVPYFFNTVWNTGSYPADSLMGVLHGIFANPAALWVGILVGLFNSTASFGTDQENVQRLLSVETRRASQRMLLWTIVAGGTVLLVYLSVGSGLAAWYAANPDASLPAKTDQILPHFIGNVLPHGLKGLLLAGIILASIDSPLISLATSFVTDLYKPLMRPGASDAELLRASRVAIAVAGVVLGVLALFFSRFDNALWIALQITSVTFGSLLGVFLFGVLFRRRCPRACVAAMISNAGLMGSAWIGIKLGALWLAWGWLVVFGTLFTALSIPVFARIFGEHDVIADPAQEPPLAGTP